MFGEMLIVDDVDRCAEKIEHYKRLCLISQDANYFAHWDYLCMISQVTGGRIALFLTYEDDELTGALPAIIKDGKYGKVMNSLPFFGSNPGAMTAEQFAPMTKKALLNMFWRASEDCLSAVLVEPAIKGGEIYGAHPCDYMDSRVSLYNILPDAPEDILPMYHPKTRNLVKKAERSGIRVTREKRYKKMVSAIEDIHVDNMQSIGAPQKPGRFFDWLENGCNAENIRLYTAKLNRKVIAGLILFVHNDTAEYYMPVASVEWRYLAPLNLVIYQAMVDCVIEGIKYWNWGGTTLPTQSGVYHFKKRFGAEESIYRYFIKVQSIIHWYDVAKLQEEYPFFYIIPYSALQKDIA